MATQITPELARQILDKGIRTRTNAFSSDGQLRDMVLVKHSILQDAGLPLDFAKRGEKVVSTSYGGLIHTQDSMAIPTALLEAIAPPSQGKGGCSMC